MYSSDFFVVVTKFFYSLDLISVKVDTIILSDAFTKMLHKFEDLLDVNLLDFESLPGASKQILFNHYDKTINSPYSFSHRFHKLPNFIREKAHGGFAGPFHRHAESNCKNPDLYPDAVTTTPNGDPILELLGLDYNALYGLAIAEFLPGKGEICAFILIPILHKAYMYFHHGTRWCWTSL